MPIVAKGEVNVHRILSKAELDNGSVVTDIESVVLLPGDSIDESEVPDYQLEIVKNGKHPLLTIMSKTDANKLKKEAEAARALAESQAEITSSVSFDAGSEEGELR